MRNHPLVTPQRSALLAARAHGMRRTLTPSEAALWELIKGSQLGFAFRRQVVIGGRFIADFVAPAAKLVVEVDGEYHRERVAAVARRDRVLGRLGYRVLRQDAEFVVHAPAEAVARIRAALRVDHLARGMRALLAVGFEQPALAIGSVTGLRRTCAKVAERERRLFGEVL